MPSPSTGGDPELGCLRVGHEMLTRAQSIPTYTVLCFENLVDANFTIRWEDWSKPLAALGKKTRGILKKGMVQFRVTLCTSARRPIRPLIVWGVPLGWRPVEPMRRWHKWRSAALRRGSSPRSRFSARDPSWPARP
jgi:hypothetical protein